MFCRKIASSKLYIKPDVLPPASAAAKYHFLHVLYQVRQWMGENLNASECGWAIFGNDLTARSMDFFVLPPAENVKV